MQATTAPQLVILTMFPKGESQDFPAPFCLSVQSIIRTWEYSQVS